MFPLIRQLVNPTLGQFRESLLSELEEWKRMEPERLAAGRTRFRKWAIENGIEFSYQCNSPATPSAKIHSEPEPGSLEA